MARDERRGPVGPFLVLTLVIRPPVPAIDGSGFLQLRRQVFVDLYAFQGRSIAGQRQRPIDSRHLEFQEIVFDQVVRVILERRVPYGRLLRTQRRKIERYADVPDECKIEQRVMQVYPEVVVKLESSLRILTKGGCCTQQHEHYIRQPSYYTSTL